MMSAMYLASPHVLVTITAIGIGSFSGAVLRWYLSTLLNPLNTELPFGTLTSNLLGGYLIGIAISYFAINQEVSPLWRLFIITGFLGGLTTFSTFSAETVELMIHSKFSKAILLISLHLVGSIAATLIGIKSGKILFGTTSL
jgi:CrcB protein